MMKRALVALILAAGILAVPAPAHAIGPVVPCWETYVIPNLVHEVRCMDGRRYWKVRNTPDQEWRIFDRWPMRATSRRA